MKREIIFSDNGVLEKLTQSLGNFFSNSKSMTLVADEDSIFIGSSLPFNHVYIDIDSSQSNANVSDLSIKYWSGKNNDFVSVADSYDGTSVSGKTLAQSGFVEFTPDKNYGWSIDDTVNSSGTVEITGLGDITIYDKYWLKLNVSNDLTATTINWIGNLFSNDDDLKAEFPDLIRTSVFNLFESGKESFFEQHIIAAQMIHKDLIKRNVMHNPNQILVRDDLILASVYKVAQIVYGAMGTDYIDDYNKIKKEYLERIENAYVKVDTNTNAILDKREESPLIGRMYR